MDALHAWVVPHIANELVETINVSRINTEGLHGDICDCMFESALFRMTTNVLSDTDAMILQLLADVWEANATDLIDFAISYGYRPILGELEDMWVYGDMDSMRAVLDTVIFFEKHWEFYLKLGEILPTEVADDYFNKLYRTAIIQNFSGFYAMTNITKGIADIAINCYQEGNERLRGVITNAIREGNVYKDSIKLLLIISTEFDDVIVGQMQAWPQFGIRTTYMSAVMANRSELAERIKPYLQ